MPSVIPPSPIDINESVSPRPSSPAEEAEEALTPTDDDDCKKSLASSTSATTPQGRRKSSVWKKALNIKKQMKMKIGEGVRRGSVFFGPTDGTPLSPVEMSPETSPHGDSDRMKSDYVQQLENEIVQSLNDLEVAMAMNKGNEESIASTVTNSDQESECDTPERRSSVDPDAEWKKRIISQPQYLQTRRSDVSEELAVRASAQSNVEGARQSRPSDLPLFDEHGRPIAPPRQRPNDSRNQRLLSVPNIKYNRTGDNVRSKVGTKKDSSFAGNLMRRFSKYFTPIRTLSYTFVLFVLTDFVNKKKIQIKKIINNKNTIKNQMTEKEIPGGKRINAIICDKFDKKKSTI